MMAQTEMDLANVAPIAVQCIQDMIDIGQLTSVPAVASELLGHEDAKKPKSRSHNALRTSDIGLHGVANNLPAMLLALVQAKVLQGSVHLGWNRGGVNASILLRLPSIPVTLTTKLCVPKIHDVRYVKTEVVEWTLTCVRRVNLYVGLQCVDKEVSLEKASADRQYQGQRLGRRLSAGEASTPRPQCRGCQTSNCPLRQHKRVCQSAERR